jgi:hypothetical protein
VLLVPNISQWATTTTFDVTKTENLSANSVAGWQLSPVTLPAPTGVLSRRVHCSPGHIEFAGSVCGVIAQDFFII